MTPTFPPTPPGPATAPLHDLRVLDASDSVAGQFAGRQLLDLGAVVVLCEPRGGSSTRRIPQLDRARGDRDTLASFVHVNAGKLAADVALEDVVADARAPLGHRDWDVVVTSSYATRDALRQQYPDAIHAVVTDFGERGPYADWSGSELVHQALSGSMIMNGAADGAPLHGVGQRAYVAAGFELAIGIAAAARARQVGIRPPRDIEVTVHESAAVMEQNFSTQWAYSHTLPQRGERYRPKGRLRCADGHVVFFFVPDRYLPMLETLGAASLVETDDRFGDYPTFLSNLTAAPDEMVAAIEAFTGDKHVADLERQAGDLGLMVAGIRTIDDLLADDHLRARGFWQDVDLGGTPVRMPGAMARFGRSRVGPLHEAPRLRSDGLLDETVRPGCTRRLQAPTVAPAATAATDGQPLAGVRVLDLTTAWAGPMATRLLASLGAEVIKVEGPRRWDVWRGRAVPFPAHQYPAAVTGPDPLNRNCWFNTQNHDKQSLVIDLKTPEGLAAARDLAAEVDLVIENFPDGTLDRLGLGYEQLRSRNRRVVVMHMSPYGSGGPLEGYRAFGPTMEALAGICGLIGYEGGPPLGSGTAYMDPMGGLAAALLAAAALRRAADDGEGEYIELCQREAAVHWIGDLVLAVQEGTRTPVPLGNRVAGWSPHGVFPTAGDDAWVAIGVCGEDDWHALCAVLALDDLAEDRDLDSVAGRRARAEEIDERIAASARGWNKHELAHRLQSRGVTAAPVHDARDLFEDVHLRARGWYQPVRHPTAELVLEYPGVPLVLDGRRHRIQRHAPAFGQDSRELLRSVGLDGERYAALVAAGTAVDAGIEALDAAAAPVAPTTVATHT